MSLRPPHARARRFALVLAVTVAGCKYAPPGWGDDGTDGGGIGGTIGTDSGPGDDTGMDTATNTTTPACSASELVWTSGVTNALGSTPLYSGDTITFWAQVTNPCATGVAATLASTCLFDEVQLTVPNGAGTQETLVSGCTASKGQLLLKPGDSAVESTTWGPIYIQGGYAYTLVTTVTSAPLLMGSFTIL
jgi:hypothetical protein